MAAQPELDSSIEKKIQALWKTLQATNNSLATCDQLIEQYCLKVASSRRTSTVDAATQTSAPFPEIPALFTGYDHWDLLAVPPASLPSLRSPPGRHGHASTISLPTELELSHKMIRVEDSNTVSERKVHLAHMDSYNNRHLLIKAERRINEATLSAGHEDLPSTHKCSALTGTGVDIHSTMKQVRTLHKDNYLMNGEIHNVIMGSDVLIDRLEALIREETKVRKIVLNLRIVVFLKIPIYSIV